MINHIHKSCGIDSLESSTIIYIDNVACVAWMQIGYIESNIIKHIATNFFYLHELHKSQRINILQVKSCDNLTDLFTKSVPTFIFQKYFHGIGIRRLHDLQKSGGVSPWTTLVQSIILHSFSLYEFTIQVLIKIFNEVISTQDHMSYFLFSPPGFWGKYTRHIYCSLNSICFSLLTRFSHMELTKRQ
jgi:hypothetical protein